MYRLASCQRSMGCRSQRRAIAEPGESAQCVYSTRGIRWQALQLESTVCNCRYSLLMCLAIPTATGSKIYTGSDTGAPFPMALRSKVQVWQTSLHTLSAAGCREQLLMRERPGRGLFKYNLKHVKFALVWFLVQIGIRRQIAGRRHHF